MEKADIPFLSASELSRLIERREVSPVEATEAYLDRIDEVDFKFNSYLTVCRKEALHAAHEAEQAIAQGAYLGPMHGIPVGVKDQLWTRRIRSTGGSRFLADSIPEEDATVIANLKMRGPSCWARPTSPSLPWASPSASALPATPGTWTCIAARPAAARGRPPPLSSALLPWARTPEAP